MISSIKLCQGLPSKGERGWGGVGDANKILVDDQIVECWGGD